jgi:hypothetical protein
MRFSTSFLAAGLTASVLAAPVFDSHKREVEDSGDDCEERDVAQTLYGQCRLDRSSSGLKD